MKSIMPVRSFALTAALAAAFLLPASRLSATGAEDKAEPRFPHVIDFAMGASGFFAGDKITITSVRGDRKHIEPGGSYLVEGTYALGTADGVALALFCTSRGPSGPTPIQEGQQVRITRGAGKFHLYETNMVDGWLHVSFYPDNSNSRGGVYFGEQGRESTIMRQQEWFAEFATNPPEKERGIDRGIADKANRALLAYLGEPVPPPAGMEALYDKEHLLRAFTAVCQRADLVITRLAVDDSEFPFLIYGTVDGAHKLPEAPAFAEQKGYAYGGSVRGSHGSGATYFAVNMVPSGQYPADQEKACHRRLMLRLQMLADKAGQSQ